MTIALLLANPVWNLPLFILITYLQQGLKLGLRQASLSCFCGVSGLSLKLSQTDMHLDSHGEVAGISHRWVLSDPLGGRNTPKKHIMELEEGLKPVSTCRSDLLNPRSDALGRSLFISFSWSGKREHLCCWYFGSVQEKTTTTNQKDFFSRSTWEWL